MTQKSKISRIDKLTKRNVRGFTLVELMVTLAVASVLMAGIYKVYQGQLKSQVVQNAVRDSQEDLRSAFYYLERTIRMAGFDPNRGARTTMPGQLGILPDLSYFGRGSVGTAFADDDMDGSKFKSIAFTLNANGEKLPPEGLVGCGNAISTDCARQVDHNDSELIAFRLYTDSKGVKSVQKYQPSKDKWWTVAHNVDDLRFEFYCDDGADPDNAVDADLDPDLIKTFDKNGDGKPDTAKLSLVRLVKITIKGRTLKDQVGQFSNDSKPYVISTMVRLRNSGLEI